MYTEELTIRPLQFLPLYQIICVRLHFFNTILFSLLCHNFVYFVIYLNALSNISNKKSLQLSSFQPINLRIKDVGLFEERKLFLTDFHATEHKWKVSLFVLLNIIKN